MLPALTEPLKGEGTDRVANLFNDSLRQSAIGGLLPGFGLSPSGRISPAGAQIYVSPVPEAG